MEIQGGNTMKSQRKDWLYVVTATISAFAFFMALTATHVQGADTKAIKVGVPGPFTGFLASDGEQMKNAANLAVEEINEDGGLLGRPIELVFGDTGAQEAEKMIAVGQMLMSKGIDAAITGYAPPPTDVRFFGQYEIPFLHCYTSFQATKPVREGLPDKMWNIFQYDSNAEEHYGVDTFRYFVREFPEKMGWTPPNKKVAVLIVDYPYNIDCAEQFKGSLPEDYEVVLEEITPFGVVDWGALIAKIRIRKPAFITFWNLSPVDTARFMAQFVENPTNSIFYSMYGAALPEFLATAKEAADGVIYSSVITGVGQRYQDFVETYRAKYDKQPYSAAAFTYDGINIWAAAVRRTGSATDYRKIARKILEYPYDGNCGHYVFNPYDQSALQGEGLIPHVFFQIQNGERHIVSPDNYATGELSIPPWIKK